MRETWDHFSKMWSPVNAVAMEVTFHEQGTPTLSHLFFFLLSFLYTFFSFVCVSSCLSSFHRQDDVPHTFAEAGTSKTTVNEWRAGKTIRIRAW